MNLLAVLSQKYTNRYKYFILIETVDVNDQDGNQYVPETLYTNENTINKFIFTTNSITFNFEAY